MQIDVYSATGEKTKALDLPVSLFEAPINWGLMHQAVTMQQSNRRQAGAHVKTRGEVQGSTKKLFAQKHTGNARRGPVRSPTLRGGGKAFGPRNDRNFIKKMPKQMRHAALRSGLSLQASKGAILGIENYPETIKTKTVSTLLRKLPVEYGRRILVVTPGAHSALTLSSRNIQGVKTVDAAYLNLEDILNARHLIFLADAIEKAEKLFGKVPKDKNVSKVDNVEKVSKVAKTKKVSTSSPKKAKS